MTPPRILIIEDEPAAARRLQNMITDLIPNVVFCGVVAGIRTSVEWFQQNTRPDLVFCDVHLSDGSSFEIFKQVDPGCPIIFSTAYDQYALEAFKVNSIDYLLKPVKREELQRALDKFRKFAAGGSPPIDIEKLLASLDRKPTYKNRFVVRFGDHIKTIETAELAYCYTENKSNYLVTKDSRRYPADYNLDQLEELLDPGKFFRINRQFIIGFHSIAEMLAYSKSRVLVKLDPPSKIETIVSAERSAAFKEWLDG